MFKEKVKKVADIIKIIYGYGIMICLFLGGATVVGFVVSMIIGGDVATQICTFIYKEFFHYLILFGGVVVLIGLLAMYLSGEKSLSVNKKKKDVNAKDKDESKEKQNIG